MTADTTDYGHRKVFLSLLPPLQADRRLAMLFLVVSTAIFLVSASFAKVPLTAVPGFIPVCQSALFMSDLLTAVLLYGQYSIQRTRSLLLLATAYLFTAVIIVPYTLSFPGLFLADGLMGSGPQTTAWLYMFWHAGFPLFVMAYAFVKDDDKPMASARTALLASVFAALFAVVLFTLLTTVGHDLLPMIMMNGHVMPVTKFIMASVAALSPIALITLWRRRPHSTLDLWMMLVMIAWTFDMTLGALLIDARFDLGYYAGRAYGMVAANFVLIMLLLETRALYARLARDLAHKRAAAEGRAEAANRTSHETAETLRAVVDASSLAVLALSPEGKVLLWNKTATRLFGYSPAEVLDRPYPLMPDEARTKAEQTALFERALAGAVLRELTFQCRCKDGTQPDIRGSAAPFYDTTGRLRGVAFALEDVTAKNATEEMLRQSQKMEAVGQLTGGVAHDFNNILMVILANVEELLESENLLPEQREQLESIAGSGQRAAELTKRLLAFSRKQRLMPQSTDLTDLVASTDRLLRRTLGEQIEIEAILADDLWTTNVDRAQLEAALVNLCVNARDAMPNGGRLLIETKNTELDSAYVANNVGVVPGKYVMLAVSDTGTGMSPEILRKVFEPFFTTKDVGKGTGLGLSMVYGFIKQSNGHIKIYSEVGRGTTIRMYMPRVDAPPEEAAVAAVAPPRGNERILVVEDDQQVRMSVLAQLRSLGYAAIEATGPHAALELLQRDGTFDLMLTDVIMPGMDGPQLAEVVAEHLPGLKVIFMSGYSENAARNHDRVAPGAHVLSKPFRKIDLASRVREVLDGA